MDLDLIAPIAAICALLIIMVIFMHAKDRQRRKRDRLKYLEPSRLMLGNHSSTNDWERAVEQSKKASEARREIKK